MDYIMNGFQNQINKYRALSFIFTILRSIVKFLGFSTPLIFLLLLAGVNFWICLGSSIVYIGLMRIAWVQCDSKTKVYKIVSEKIKERKEEILKENFK